MAKFADQGCATLAYGDAKRVELALALAGAPRLLLMDEPTAGMSPRSRDRVMKLAAELARQQRIAVLFTEHDMDVVFGYADRVIVLDRGAIIAEGPPAAIRADARVQAVYLGEDDGRTPRAAASRVGSSAASRSKPAARSAIRSCGSSRPIAQPQARPARVPPRRRAHALGPHRDDQALEAAPAPAHREQAHAVEHRVDPLARDRVQHDAEEAGGAGEVALPQFVAAGAGQRRIDDLLHLGPRRRATRAISSALCWCRARRSGSVRRPRRPRKQSSDDAVTPDVGPEPVQRRRRRRVGRR